MSDTSHNANDVNLGVERLRYGSPSSQALYYRPPMSRVPLLDYWLSHGSASAPQVAIVRGPDSLGYQFGLHWLLTAALHERARVGAVTVDGTAHDVWEDISRWKAAAESTMCDLAERDVLGWRWDFMAMCEAKHAEHSWKAFHDLCQADPFRYHQQPNAAENVLWAKHMIRLSVHRARWRRTVPFGVPTIRAVSLSGVELLNDPWRAHGEWEETVARPLMLLIATRSTDANRLAMLREHAHWVARFTEAFVVLCEPEAIDSDEPAAREDEIFIRLSHTLPSWLPETRVHGIPVALHARAVANSHQRFAMEIDQRTGGYFESGESW